MARSLLAGTTSLRGLFLTGALQQLVCDKNPLLLPSLRDLPLGPLTRAHGDSLAHIIKCTPLAALERLTIRGLHLVTFSAKTRWEMQWLDGPAEE